MESAFATFGATNVAYYETVHGKRTLVHLRGMISPKHCPSGGFPSEGIVEFANGTSLTVNPTIPSPEASRATHPHPKVNRHRALPPSTLVHRAFTLGTLLVLALTLCLASPLRASASPGTQESGTATIAPICCPTGLAPWAPYG